MKNFARLKYYLERSHTIFFSLYALLISMVLVQLLLDNINVCSNIVYFDTQNTFLFLTLPLFPIWFVCVCLEKFNVIKLKRKSFYGFFFVIHFIMFTGTISRLGDGSYPSLLQLADYNALRGYLNTYKEKCGHFPEESNVSRELKLSSSCQEFLKTVKDKDHDQYIEYLLAIHKIVINNEKLNIENRLQREYAWCKDYRYKGIRWSSFFEKYIGTFKR